MKCSVECGECVCYLIDLRKTVEAEKYILNVLVYFFCYLVQWLLGTKLLVRNCYDFFPVVSQSGCRLLPLSLVSANFMVLCPHMCLSTLKMNHKMHP